MSATQERPPSALSTFIAAVTRNPISLLGTAITTASAVLFVSLWGMSLIGFRGGPYLGLLIFVALPSVFVGGLVLIPFGLWREKRRRVSGAPITAPFPILDLNHASTRRITLVVLGATLVNVVLIAVATYEGIEVMDTVEFCGKTCHSVMDPEFTTYSRSPHSRVRCVECHIGPGAGWFVKSKLSGSWQLVSVAFDLYPRPIKTPVHSLRPARETCEQCHWPTKFVGERLKVITHFTEDEANTPTKTILSVRVGGLQGAASHGIHWHVDPGVEVRYRSDRARETIYEVSLKDRDGTVRTYRGPKADTPEGKAEAEWRTMDCVDCHNRPTHIYRLPRYELDRALEDGRIDGSLPFIRREGLKALQATYPSHDAARTGIADALGAFYAKEYASRVPELGKKIDAAARELGEIWCTNVFPSMNITWGTYPNHIGHTDPGGQDTPGCFRCHDGEHATADGRTISQDCDTCHAVLAMDERDPAVLKQIRP